MSERYMDAQLGLWTRSDTRWAGNPDLLFAIRPSARAKHLILQVLPPRTIEVVVPRGTRADAVESFVDEHHDWIDRAGRELIRSYPHTEIRPAQVDLAAIGRTVEIGYESCGDRSPYYRDQGKRLRLHCRDDCRDDAIVLLQRWLRRLGRRVLEPWLARQAARTNLRPTKVQVRLQKTRWGSCSSSGNISLNAALLLVPAELVDYLLVHELCHLRHLSHSRRYWRLVALHAPAYRELDRRLASSWARLPAWLHVVGQSGL